MDIMAKVEINRHTPAGMLFVAGVIATAVGVINLLSGDATEHSMMMLAVGPVVIAISIFLMLKPRRRNPNAYNAPVYGMGNGMGPNRNIRNREELYFLVCNNVADLHVVPRIQWTYGHENLRQRIRQDPQFAWVLFQQEPSRDLLQYIYSFDQNAAYLICVNAANALSWNI